MKVRIATVVVGLVSGAWAAGCVHGDGEFAGAVASTDRAVAEEAPPAGHFEPEAVEGGERWSWPAPEVFDEFFRAGGGELAAGRVGYGAVVYEPAEGADEDRCIRWRLEDREVLFAVEEEAEKARFLVLMAPVGGYNLHHAMERASEYQVVEGLDGASPRFIGECGELSMELEYVSPRRPVSLGVRADRAYAKGLLAGVDLYDERSEWSWDDRADGLDRLQAFQTDDAEEVRAAVDALFEADVATHDYTWSVALDAAARVGDDELARRVHRRYQPVGQCSQDSTPRLVAEQYAEVCERLGDTGCYLALRLQVLNNRFERMAWSSIAEAMHDPAVRSLAVAPIDVDRFLRGLMVQVPSAGGFSMGLSPWRMGAAAARDREVSLDSWAQVAGDEGVDELNRLLATMVVYFAAHYTGVDDEERRAVLEGIEMAPSAEFFVRRSDEARAERGR